MKSVDAHRRAILGALLTAVVPARMVFAQNAWPAKPVRWICPYPVGGPTDLVTRLVAAKLAESLGPAFVVDNKPGANGNIGAEIAAKAAPDGYTIFLGTGSTHGINPHLYRKLAYDAVRDFEPVVLLTESMLYLVVNNSVPATDVKQFVAYVRANPGKISYASVGTGSAHHLAAEMLKQRAGIDMFHVPYKGSPQALQDLIAGRVQVMFDASAIPLVRSGQLRALAVASTKRWPQIPELPSMAEQGFPDFYVGGWFGMFVPTGTPKEIINRLNAEANRILRTPDFQSRITQAGLEVKGGTVEEAKAFVKSELAKWGAVVKASGARADD